MYITEFKEHAFICGYVCESLLEALVNLSCAGEYMKCSRSTRKKREYASTKCKCIVSAVAFTVKLILVSAVTLYTCGKVPVLELC